MRPLPRSRNLFPSASNRWRPSPRTITGAARPPCGSHGVRTYFACLAWISAVTLMGRHPRSKLRRRDDEVVEADGDRLGAAARGLRDPGVHERLAHPRV